MTNTPANQAHKRVLVTGGAGEMGAYACTALAKADEVSELLIADRDLSKATTLADQLGPKARPLLLDISDADAVHMSLVDVDIVLNTAGPFYRFGRSVLMAAIATGTNYVDICDDWEPTLEMLELDDEARSAGVTAVIGMGASPGTSNMCARLAMDELNSVDRVYTVWRAGGMPKFAPEDPLPEPSAAFLHWIHNCTEQIKIWRGGELRDAQALEELVLSYPGTGRDRVWVCGHPEPLTLPRVRPEIQESLNLMVSRPGLMEALQRVAARVRTGELDVVSASKQLFREPGTRGPAAGPEPTLPNLFAVAEGFKNGQAIRVGAQPLAIPKANMGEATGYPLAVATLMMARGHVEKPGVHGPEGALCPATYFQELSALLDAPDSGPAFEVVTEEI